MMICTKMSRDCKNILQDHAMLRFQGKTGRLNSASPMFNACRPWHPEATGPWCVRQPTS